jgi:hypothetical protein
MLASSGEEQMEKNKLESFKNGQSCAGDVLVAVTYIEEHFYDSESVAEGQ